MERNYASVTLCIGNESVPKIIYDTINLYFKTAISILLISNHNSFRVMFDKIASVYFICKMASPGKKHCANCIGTLSFPMLHSIEDRGQTTAAHQMDFFKDL